MNSPILKERWTDLSFILGYKPLSRTETSSPALEAGIIEGYNPWGLVKSKVVDFSCVSANDDRENSRQCICLTLSRLMELGILQ